MRNDRQFMLRPQLALAEARQRAKRRPVQLTQQESEMTLSLGYASVVHRFRCEELRTDVETKEP